MSDSLQPHESQHTRPPCPSPTPGVHPDSRPSSQWCHPAISSSVVPFSSCPQSLPASESFPMSQLWAWGGQSTRVSALASFLPRKSQGLTLAGGNDNNEWQTRLVSIYWTPSMCQIAYHVLHRVTAWNLYNPLIRWILLLWPCFRGGEVTKSLATGQSVGKLGFPPTVGP